MLKKISALAILGVASFANANDFITNGDFESHGNYDMGSWNYFYNNVNPVAGWYSDDNSTPVEIGTPGTYGVLGDNSNSILELDSTQNSSVSQNITGANGSLELNFDFAKRAGTSDETNNFQVLWDGNVVATVDPTSTTLSSYSPIMLTGTGSDKLTFRGVGTSDSYGGMVDNVHLQSVPEPCSLTILGLGIAGLLKRKRS